MGGIQIKSIKNEANFFYFARLSDILYTLPRNKRRSSVQIDITFSIELQPVKVFSILIGHTGHFIEYLDTCRLGSGDY